MSCFSSWFVVRGSSVRNGGCDWYAGDVQEFASAFGLDGDKKLLQSIYKRTVDKLSSEPVEDLRIDFEDGYGFRSNDEEDADARRASNELAKAIAKKSVTPFCGFR